MFIPFPMSWGPPCVPPPIIGISSTVKSWAESPMFSIMRRTDWPRRRRISAGSKRRSSVARTRTSRTSESPSRPDPPPAGAGRPRGGYEGNLAHLEGRSLRGRVAVKRQAEVGLAAVATVVDEHPEPRVADLTAVDGHLKLLLGRLSPKTHTLFLSCP